MEGLLDWPEKIRASSLSLSGEPERAFGGPRHQQQAMEVERGRDGETGYRLPHLKSSPVIMIAVVAFAGIIDGLFRAHGGLPTVLGEEVSGTPIWHSQAAELMQTSVYDQPSEMSMLLQKPEGGACKKSWNCVPGLVCLGGFCATCENDEQCMARNSKNRCQNITKDEPPQCHHKPLFGPFDTSDVIIVIVTFFTIVLAAPAGVGGGGILVPMYLAVGHFSPHYGIPLSKATILGGAITNNYFNLQRRHPVANRPLVDYTTSMILEPVLLLGTIIGVFFNAVSPGWAITVLLVITLCFTTWRTGTKAYETYLKEEKDQAEDENKRLIPSSSKDREKHFTHGDAQDMSPEMAAIVKSESEHNLYAVGVLCVAWVVIATFSLLKGGEGGEGIYPCGSIGYWLLVAAPLPITIALVWYVGNQASATYERKVELGYDFCDGDLLWTKRNTRIFPLYCIVAGFAAGSLGIAAGTILGPVLLEFGLLPIVATTSSGFMVIFTASSTTFQFLVMGQLQVDYAVFFCFIGLFGGAVGNTGVNFLVKKYKKTWFVVAILTFVLFMSVFLMGYAGYVRWAIAEKHGKNMGLRSLCPAHFVPNIDLLHNSTVAGPTGR